MSFKFMSNKIDTRSKVPSLLELVKLARAQKSVGVGSKIVTASKDSEDVDTDLKDKDKKEDKKEDKDKDGEENTAFPGAAPLFKKKEVSSAKKSSSKKSSAAVVVEEEDCEEECEEDAVEKDKPEKVASSKRFVRIAELSDKQKTFLRATWSLYWPKSFIDAILAAK